ncbi:hypothetical protein BLNAU_12818 [Blattamonas nauphoetae]|uniref:Uncharacterized protein n=1 Tax=Blattamonas nauphoetae TaxID=2049346 RepID=A0ABQ9XLB7_9EUKA|nr:hypothetical protein BLNAU_12818 [Blattamonas nauphoetae]
MKPKHIREGSAELRLYVVLEITFKARSDVTEMNCEAVAPGREVGFTTRSRSPKMKTELAMAAEQDKKDVEDEMTNGAVGGVARSDVLIHTRLPFEPAPLAPQSLNVTAVKVTFPVAPDFGQSIMVLISTGNRDITTFSMKILEILVNDCTELKNPTLVNTSNCPIRHLILHIFLVLLRSHR